MAGLSFQNLGGLVWLAPLAAVIVILYLLKMRRRDVRVPATFLWPDKVEEIRANALFQKLRPNLLLFLQLLALALVVFAYARPQTMQRGLTGQVTVLVLDSSASMSATDVTPSRFEEAKKLAREAIQSAHAGDRMALIEAGPTPKVVFALSSDPAKQLRALDPLKVTDSAASVGEALRLAGAIVGPIEGARIVLLSDGDFEPVQNFSRGKAALVYKAIGEFGDNLAISALGVAQTTQGRQLFCGIKNYGTKPMDGKLTVYADGDPIDSLKIPTVAPNSQWGRTVTAPPGAKVFEAKLEASDILKSDNYAVTVSDPGAALKVLLVSRGDPFLERALSLDPRVTLDRATEVPIDEQPGPGDGVYDVVVFDGVDEQPVKARGVLNFGAASTISPVTASGTAAKPTFVSSDKSDLMEAVNLHGVFIDSQQKVSPKDLGKVVAESSAGPLVITSETPGKRQIYVAFEPLNSDFPLQVAFPIFIANALDYLGGSSANGALAVETGRPFTLPWTKDATIDTPNNGSIKLKATGSTLVVRDTKDSGKYTLHLGDTKRTIYATLKNERESDVKPVKELAFGGGQVKSVDAPLRFADFWKPLALLALLVLGFEWYVFARRS
ncbi:BatA and WFA domain-containing protein [soil metagenome]